MGCNSEFVHVQGIGMISYKLEFAVVEKIKIYVKPDACNRRRKSFKRQAGMDEN